MVKKKPIPSQKHELIPKTMKRPSSKGENELVLASDDEEEVLRDDPQSSDEEEGHDPQNFSCEDEEDIVEDVNQSEGENEQWEQEVIPENSSEGDEEEREVDVPNNPGEVEDDEKFPTDENGKVLYQQVRKNFIKSFYQRLGLSREQTLTLQSFVATQARDRNLLQSDYSYTKVPADQVSAIRDELISNFRFFPSSHSNWAANHAVRSFFRNRQSRINTNRRLAAKRNTAPAALLTSPARNAAQPAANNRRLPVGQSHNFITSERIRNPGISPILDAVLNQGQTRSFSSAGSSRKGKEPASVNAGNTARSSSSSGSSRKGKQAALVNAGNTARTPASSARARFSAGCGSSSSSSSVFNSGISPAVDSVLNRRQTGSFSSSGSSRKGKEIASVNAGNTVPTPPTSARSPSGSASSSNSSSSRRNSIVRPASSSRSGSSLKGNKPASAKSTNSGSAAVATKKGKKPVKAPGTARPPAASRNPAAATRPPVSPPSSLPPRKKKLTGYADSNSDSE